MRANRENLDKALADVTEQLKQLDAKKIILFGFLGRGKVRLGSDIDLLVLFDDNDTFKSRVRKLYSAIESPVDFDLLANTAHEFERIKNRTLFRHILKKGKMIYET